MKRFTLSIGFFASGGRCLITLCLVSFAFTLLSSCKSKEERDEAKPYKPKRVRDPVEQKVFYDGWWPENW